MQFHFQDGSYIVFSKSVYDKDRMTLTFYKRVIRNSGLVHDYDITSLELGLSDIEGLSRYFSGWVDERLKAKETK